MKQILVISGKGGTGKTVISGAFASLAEKKIMVDCDVDAADLYLLLNPVIKERYEFKSGQSAVIDKDLCKNCGQCLHVCRFKAIKPDFSIESFSCEGCMLCLRVCPYGAIQSKENVAGEWFVSETRCGPFVHAKLGIAEENSGKLVAKIRQIAREMAVDKDLDFVIIDGPPGIGCPVIASLSGVDCALIVTEPTISGLHDARRVIELANHFKIPVNLVINKYNLNPDISAMIDDFCRGQKIPVIGKIAFDENVVNAMVKGQTIIEYGQCTIEQEVRNIWHKLRV